MDPKDIPPLRAGLGGPGRAVMPDTDATPARQRLIAMVAVMTQRAGMMAYQLCSHDGRSAATSDDVNAALKHQARHILTTADEEQMMRDVDAMEQNIFGNAASSDSSCGSNSFSGGSDSDESVSSEPPRDAAGKCMCSDCVQVREAVDTWEAWAPEDEAHMYLKSSVDRAIAMTQERLAELK